MQLVRLNFQVRYVCDTGWDLERAAFRRKYVADIPSSGFCRIAPESLEGSNGGQRRREYHIVVCLQSLQFSVSFHPNKGKRNYVSFLKTTSSNT